jgi:hypothetical protein
MSVWGHEGGRVVPGLVAAPPSDFHSEKVSDPLYAFAIYLAIVKASTILSSFGPANLNASLVSVFFLVPVECNVHRPSIATRLMRGNSGYAVLRLDSAPVS